MFSRLLIYPIPKYEIHRNEPIHVNKSRDMLITNLITLLHSSFALHFASVIHLE